MDNNTQDRLLFHISLHDNKDNTWLTLLMYKHHIWGNPTSKAPEISLELT